MWLPTPSQVNAASRHIASFAGGVILAFGLSTKINPDTVQQIITQTGTVINDVCVLLGLVGPIIAAYFASRSANPIAQVNAAKVVAEKPGAQQEAAKIAIANAAADLPGSKKVVNPDLASNPATSSKVTAS